MGLTTETREAIYLTISNGKLVQQHKEKTSLTVERVNKKSVLVHEQMHSHLEAHLISISVKEYEFGKQFQASFYDRSEKKEFVVCMPYSSKYSAYFLKSLPNIDSNIPVKISPWSNPDKINPKKIYNGLMVSQNGTRVPWYFTRDNPNGCPQLKVIKWKGEDKWDDTEMMDFLSKVAMDWSEKHKGSEVFPFLIEESPQYPQEWDAENGSYKNNF